MALQPRWEPEESSCDGEHPTNHRQASRDGTISPPDVDEENKRKQRAARFNVAQHVATGAAEISSTQSLLTSVRSEPASSSAEPASPRVVPKKESQARYMRMLADASKQVVVAVGPSGTGKTFLAVHEGLQQLDAGVVDKMILTRPPLTTSGEYAEAEEGASEEAKARALRQLNRPALDAILKVRERPRNASSYWERLLQTGQLELQPFDSLRGLSFDRCYVVADEVQSASKSTLLDLARRAGETGKLCIVGDAKSQNDRRDNWAHTTTGLEVLAKRIESDEKLQSDGTACVRFTVDDIVRSGSSAALTRLLEEEEDETESAPDRAGAARRHFGTALGAALRGYTDEAAAQRRGGMRN
jgi:phosphate starvation-inducible PhoH-like protein